MEQKRKIPILLDAVLLVLFTSLVFPPITVFINATVINLLCLILWFLLSFLVNSEFYLKANYHRFYLFIFFILTVLLPYVFGNGVIGNRYLSTALVPFGVIIYEFYKENSIYQRLKNILLATAVFAIVTGIITYVNLLIDPYVSRSIKNGSDEYSAGLAARGIGGYHFIYFVAIVSIPILYVFIKSRKILTKVVSILLYVFCLLIVIKANYLTAFIIIISCSIILIAINFSRGKPPFSQIALFSFLIIGFICVINIDLILKSMGNILPPRIAKVILNDDINVFQSIRDEFVSGRLPTIVNSLSTAFKRPVLGLISSQITTSHAGYLEGFGQHSYVFDTFALYGIILGIVNFYVILRPFKCNGKFVRNSMPLSITMAICVITLYCVNNATNSIGLVSGVVFPLVRDYFIFEE